MIVSRGQLDDHKGPSDCRWVKSVVRISTDEPESHCAQSQMARPFLICYDRLPVFARIVPAWSRTKLKVLAARQNNLTIGKRQCVGAAQRIPPWQFLRNKWMPAEVERNGAARLLRGVMVSGAKQRRRLHGDAHRGRLVVGVTHGECYCLLRFYRIRCQRNCRTTRRLASPVTPPNPGRRPGTDRRR